MTGEWQLTGEDLDPVMTGLVILLGHLDPALADLAGIQPWFFLLAYKRLWRNLEEAPEEPLEGSTGLAGLVSLCHFYLALIGLVGCWLWLFLSLKKVLQ